jgi:hypothetical protein
VYVTFAGSVASITGGLLASGPDAAALNDNQTFLMYVSPELRRRYESTLLSQVEQVGQQLNNLTSMTASIADSTTVGWPCALLVISAVFAMSLVMLPSNCNVVTPAAGSRNDC